MRREGFELSVGRPSVIIKVIDGVKMEPYERIMVDVQEGHDSWVMEQMVIFIIAIQTLFFSILV